MFVRLADPSPARFERFLSDVDGVVAAWHTIGDIDLAVQIHCPDLTTLDRIITAMRIDGGAAGTTTHLVVRQVDLIGPTAVGNTVQFQAPRPTTRRSLRRAAR